MKCENLAEKRLLEEGYEGVVIFNNYSYDTALVGVTNTHRAVYNYDLMLEFLVSKEGFSDYTEAAEWIDYNTLGSLPFFGGRSPIILYPKLYDEQTALECTLDMGYDEGAVYIIPELDSAFLGISHSGAAVYDLESSEEIIPGISNSNFYTEKASPVFMKTL